LQFKHKTNLCAIIFHCLGWFYSFLDKVPILNCAYLKINCAEIRKLLHKYMWYHSYFMHVTMCVSD
jgi:hypothetical protein